MPINCLECGKPLTETKIRRNGLYCNRACGNQGVKREYKEANPSLGLSTGTVGALAELLVAVDLMRLGFEVFRAMSPACSCDLSILKDKKLWRVEVKTGYRRVNDKLYYQPSKKHPHRAEILAIVVHSDPPVIRYFPELATLHLEWRRTRPQTLRAEPGGRHPESASRFPPSRTRRNLTHSALAEGDTGTSTRPVIFR